MEKRMQSSDTATLIRQLENLPPLSRQARQLLTILGDPDLDTDLLIELLRQSPALAARILGVARSAFFAGPSPPRDLPDAVIRFLGLALVRDLTIAFILSDPLRGDLCSAFKPHRYWRHSLWTATLAEKLATGRPIPNGSLAYLAGLLHNLGLLALVHVAPAPMQAVFLELEGQDQAVLSEVEGDRLGIDHCGAGRLLAAAWHLPPEIASVMSFHRDRQYQGRHSELVTLVALAASYCSKFETAANPEIELAEVLLNRVGLDSGIWERAIKAWKPGALHIAELATQFT